MFYSLCAPGREDDLRKCLLITCLMKMSIAKNELVAMHRKIAGILTIAWNRMKPVINDICATQ